MGIGRTFGLGNDIGYTDTLKNGTHGTTGLQTSTSSSGLEKNLCTTELDLNLVGNSSFENRNLHKVLLGSLCSLCNGSSYLSGLTKTIADDTLAITYNNDGSKRESATTLSNFRHTVDGHQTIF